ncbi:MAG: phosphonate ABC transporter ATP-binding protein [Dehalococcoidia bacterium]
MGSSNSNTSAHTGAGGRDALAVALEDVSQRYGQVTVLGPLSLAIEPGEAVALVGPSGAGKTTLLRILAGLLRPTAGRNVLHGEDMAAVKSGAQRSRLVGMVAQQFDLVPNLSTLNNVLAGRLGQWSFPRALFSLLFPMEKQSAFDALDRVGILDRAYLRAGLLSGGEQQRAAIARVLVQDPAIILADEPVASLDPARAEEVLRLLVEVTRDSGKTLIASLHAIELARNHFDRIIGLRNGEVHFDLPTSDVSEARLAELYDLQGMRGEV